MCTCVCGLLVSCACVVCVSAYVCACAYPCVFGIVCVRDLECMKAFLCCSTFFFAREPSPDHQEFSFAKTLKSQEIRMSQKGIKKKKSRKISKNDNGMDSFLMSYFKKLLMFSYSLPNILNTNCNGSEIFLLQDPVYRTFYC